MARQASDALREALEPTGFDPDPYPIAFRIATGDAIAATLMPSLVAQFARTRALAKLRVVDHSRDDPVRLGLVFCFARQRQPGSPPSQLFFSE